MVYLLTWNVSEVRRGGGGGGGTVAESVERATSGQEVVGAIGLPALGSRSLLVG